MLQAMYIGRGVHHTPFLLSPRACCVTLTGSDYYTVPPLDECDQLVKGGTCLVEGFTVGRKGYGEIHFPGQTDVYGLDLDRIGE